LKDGKSHLSDLLAGPRGTKVIEWAIPFRARTGRRVQLSGLSQRLLAQFLGGFLGQVPNVASADSYVVDGHGLVVGSTTRSAPQGAPLPDRDLAEALAKH